MDLAVVLTDFFFQAEDGIRYLYVTGVQTCALPILGELLAHGIEVMPGKPAALGVVGGKPVLGVPGYPVSAYVICEEFLRPLVFRLGGLSPPPRASVPAVIGRRTPSRSEEHTSELQS